MLVPRVVLKRARVVKQADARGLFASAEQFFPCLDQRRQPLIAPVEMRVRILFGGRAPKHRQHHVDPRGCHILKLPAMPGHRFVAESFKRRGMRRERIRAVPIDDVRF